MVRTSSMPCGPRIWTTSTFAVTIDDAMPGRCLRKRSTSCSKSVLARLPVEKMQMLMPSTAYLFPL